MAKKSYTISFDQAADDKPLKILPKNTWVKINNFKNPCRLLEICAQSLTIDVKSEPETLTLHAGQNIKVEILNISEEKPFILEVTIFHIDDEECLCQIPLYFNDEEILIDKIILEIQKNEIGGNKAPNAPHSAKHASGSQDEAAPFVPTDENIAPILNNLIAMLPDETKEDKEEHVTANQLTDIPKSSYTYQQVDLSKIFDKALELAEEDEKHRHNEDNEDNEEFEDEFEEIASPKLPPHVHPLTLLRYSIVNKFLLDNLEDAFPQETAVLEQAQLDVSELSESNMAQGTIPETAQRNSRKKKKAKKLTKQETIALEDVENFLPSNLLKEMSVPNFMDDIKQTHEFDYSLSTQKKDIDKDAEFEQYYEFSSDMSPEVIAELMRESKKKKKEYEGLDEKDKTNEYGFTVADDENYEGVDDDEFVLGKFDNLLKNKRVIKLNINNDADVVTKTDIEKDKEFLEKFKSQTPDNKARSNSKFKFKLDI